MRYYEAAILQGGGEEGTGGIMTYEARGCH